MRESFEEEWRMTLWSLNVWRPASLLYRKVLPVCAARGD